METREWRQWFRDLITLWRSRDKLADRNFSADLKSFLPPALEIIETPPHPAAGWLLRIIMAIVVVALVWSILGKVNVISVAEGKIVPAGKVKIIQPYGHSKISAIRVTEGQMVEVGQVLIEFERTQSEAEVIKLTTEKSIAEAKRNRRQAMIKLLQAKSEQPVENEAVINHPAIKGDLDNGLLLLDEYNTTIYQRQSLEYRIKERRAELANCVVKIAQYTVNTPLAKKRLDSLKSLYDKKMSGLNDYMSAEVYYNEQIYGLEAEKQRFEQITAAILSAEKELAVQVAQSLVTAKEELIEQNRQLETIDQELVKANDILDKQVLYSPVKGSVKGLQTNTIGGMVESNQVLMEIVPFGETLEVEAFLSNQDIGYVKAGQSAEVKIATYPFTKYGVINAIVDHVAEDATVDEKMGLIYRVRLTLERNTIVVNKREEPLVPGMAVSAEISTDKRRLIEFVLAPLLRMKDESLRER